MPQMDPSSGSSLRNPSASATRPSVLLLIKKWVAQVREQLTPSFAV